MADLGFDFSSDEHDQDAAFEQPTQEETEIVHNGVVEPDMVLATEEPMPPEEEMAMPVLVNESIQEPLEDEMHDELLPDENLTIIERIHTFKSDDIVLHRLLVAKELPSALLELGIEEALEKVLPIMDKLASDPDDTVRETFASELDQTLLYFYKNAPSKFSSKDEHTPQEHSFANLFINILLDPNSGVASLGQQAIITAITELYETCLSSREEARHVVDCEIYEGVIEGLMEIVNGKIKPPRLEHHDQEDEESQQYHRVSIDETNASDRRRSSTTPGFESSLNVHHAVPSDDEIDQGEITLAKITCISLIASTASILGSERCTNNCVSIIEQLASDQVFYVRKEAATALGSLALVVDTRVAEEKLLPLYREFMEDQVWHVRRSSVMSLPHLCGILTDESRAEIAVLSVEAFKNDTSRNVRNTMAEVVGDLISRFLPPNWEQTGQPGNIPEPILEYFLSLGSSTNGNSNQMLKLETDRSFICAYNFPVVVLTAGVEYWNTHLRDTYLNLTKDYQIKVRCTFAHSLHEIAKIIGPERTERDLVQIFALYLMDLDDVKQGVLEHLADFLGTLAISSRNEYIPILAEVWDGVTTNWRLRNILAAQLREIAMLFDASRVVEHVLPLVVRACHDEFAAVRETGIDVFPVVLDVVKRAVDEDGESLSQTDGYGDDISENKRNLALALLSHVMERLDEFARSENYRGRLVFAQICKSLIEAGIGASDFASFFLPRLAPLAYDPVVNVRIAVSRTIGTIYTNEPFRRELSEIAAPSRTVNQAGESGHALEQMTYRFALDKDGDVRSYVMSFVDPDTLEKQREKEMKTAAALAEASIEERAAEYKDDHHSDMDEDEEEEEEEDDEDEDDEVEEDEEAEDEEEDEERQKEDEDHTMKTSNEVQHDDDNNNNSNSNSSNSNDTTAPIQEMDDLRSPPTVTSVEHMDDGKVSDEDEPMLDADPEAPIENDSMDSEEKPLNTTDTTSSSSATTTTTPINTTPNTTITTSTTPATTAAAVYRPPEKNTSTEVDEDLDLY